MIYILGYCGLSLNSYTDTSPDSFIIDDTATTTSINVSTFGTTGLGVVSYLGQRHFGHCILRPDTFGRKIFCLETFQPETFGHDDISAKVMFQPSIL